MKYKHVIWDWNGTLLDDRWLCVKSVNLELLKRDLPPLTEEGYRAVFTFPVEEYYKKIGFSFDKEPFNKVGDRFVSYYANHFSKVRLHQNSISILQKILLCGTTQSILSAGKQEFLDQWVNEHDLEKYFIKILGIDNQYAKGKTDIGKTWIDELLYDSKSVVMIGDTGHDSDVASTMGIDCVLVDHGHVSNDRLKETGRVVLNNLDQVFEFIK